MINERRWWKVILAAMWLGKGVMNTFFITMQKGEDVFSLAYFSKKIEVGLWDHVAVCMYIPPIVARQWLIILSIAAKWGLNKHIPAAMNNHTTLVELLDSSVSVWFVLYQRSVGD
jgi:hypothetical protein